MKINKLNRKDLITNRINSVDFTWKRFRLFDKFIAALIYEKCVENKEAIVKNVIFLFINYFSHI